MNASLNDDLVKVWVAGWAACRGYETRDEGRFATALVPGQSTGSSDGWQTFVLEPSVEELSGLAADIAGSPRLLYVFTDKLQDVRSRAASNGLHISGSFQSLMCASMLNQDIEDPISPDGYETAVSRGDGVHHVVVTHNGDEAARGSVAVVADHAVFDRIITAPAYRRQGLGSYVMRALTAAVMEYDVENGLLLASPDGRQLYGFLGWTELTEMLMLQGQKPVDADVVELI